MRILKLLFLTILFLFPFGEVLRFHVGTNVYIKPLDIAVGLTTLWWGIRFYLLEKKQRLHLPWYFFLFPLVGFISLLLYSPLLQNNEFLISLLYLVRWIAYLGIIGVVRTFDTDFRKTVHGMLTIVGIIILLFGMWQYFFYNDIRNLFFIGWDDHIYRLFASFFDPNFAGAFFVLLFLSFAGMVYQNIQYPLRDWRIWTMSITIIAVFLTFSRSALVMLLVGSGVFLYLIHRKRLLFFLIGILAIVILSISPFFHIENLNLLRTASIGARIDTAQNALRIIVDHPIMGVGFDSYRYAQESYGFVSSHPMYPSNADAGTDNSWLFVLATTGVIGFGVYCYFWFRLLQFSYHCYQKKNILGAVFIASSSGLFIDSFFINSLFYPELMLWMWILFGLLQDKKSN